MREVVWSGLWRRNSTPRDTPPCPLIQVHSFDVLLFAVSAYFMQLIDGAVVSLFCDGAARFSPDDKFSRERITNKKRHGILLTQLPQTEL